MTIYNTLRNLCGAGGFSRYPSLIKKPLPPCAGGRANKNMSKNFDAYIAFDKKGLENKYVVIINGKVVAAGEYIEKILNGVKKEYPNERPFVAKVQGEKVFVL